MLYWFTPWVRSGAPFIDTMREIRYFIYWHWVRLYDPLMTAWMIPDVRRSWEQKLCWLTQWVIPAAPFIATVSETQISFKGNWWLVSASFGTSGTYSRRLCSVSCLLLVLSCFVVLFIISFFFFDFSIWVCIRFSFNVHSVVRSTDTIKFNSVF